MSRSDAISAAYLVAAICFILGIRFLSAPRTARRGNLIAAVGMAIAIVATLADEIVQDYWWIAGRRRGRQRDRRRLGPARAHDRDAADGRAVQRRRRRRGRAHRRGRAARGAVERRHAGGAHGDRHPLLGDRRLRLVRRLAGRVREAAGDPAGPADHLARAEGHQRRGGAGGARGRDLRGGRRPRRGALPGARRPVAAAGRRRRPADRRRGHAGRHLAAQRLHRAWPRPRRASCCATTR